MENFLLREKEEDVFVEFFLFLKLNMSFLLVDLMKVNLFCMGENIDKILDKGVKVFVSFVKELELRKELLVLIFIF